ncbi:MAG: CIA30 family protein [Pseudomonadota bacterium]
MTCDPLRPDWEYVADTVMGGVSAGRITPISQDGRAGMRLTGTVSLENNGGFIQMAFDPDPSAQSYDASAFDAISFDTRGNGATYAVSLRTTELSRPWHSYRGTFETRTAWQRVRIPFAEFAPSNTDIPLNRAKLRRIGIIAVGRAFDVDVSVANLCFSG